MVISQPTSTALYLCGGCPAWLKAQGLGSRGSTIVKVSVVHLINSKTHIVAIVVLGILLIPLFTSGHVLNSSEFHSSQADTIWEEIDHDYIRADAIALDIMFRNSTHGWALTQNRSSFGHGMILHSNDSGFTWHLQYYNETSWLHQIELVNEHLWVTSEGGLLRSINDGQTWNFILVGSDHDNFRCVHFFNETLGWAGSNRGIYLTQDGGTTWQKIMVWASDDKPRRFHFTTPQNGWLIGAYNIYHSSDGGVTWEVSHSKGGWTFSFISDVEAWAVGDNMLAHMVDGVTWIEQPLPVNEYGRLPYMTDIHFLNKTHGWIGGSDPLIAHTQNGGLDWYEQSVPVGSRINAVHFFNESLGWAIGWGGYIVRTTRGDELGSYSWSTSSPIVVYAVVTITIVVVGSLGLLLFKRRHRGPDSPPTIT
jgi:photosystem II stability/assembly factor-like uncharacterized protein